MWFFESQKLKVAKRKSEEDTEGENIQQKVSCTVQHTNTN